MHQGQKLVLSQYGEDREDAIENDLKLETFPKPEVGKLQPHEVIIGIHSASVSFVDLLMLSGQYQTMVPLPCVPGMEYSGVVLATGRDVDVNKLAVGDRVLSDFLVTGPRSKGAYQAEGGWQSYAIAPEHGVHKLPDNLSFDEGCNLLLNYETPYYAFINRAKLQAGETVLITGASGAAGMAAIQVAKLLGAKVIATGRSDEKLAQVKKFGADHVINTSPRPGEAGIPKFREEVKALTGGRGVEVVFDTVGGDVSEEAMRSLDFGGRLVIIGWAQNTKVAKGGGKRGSDNADRLPTNIMQMKGLFVMGSPMVIHSGRDPSIRVPRLESIFKGANDGLLTPFVSHCFPMEDYKRAMYAKISGEVNGGCVLNPWTFSL
ncbi:NADPH:quinone oxidoreductase family protein [Sneathiella sp. HT1-7]|uniref:NADPH:quinone oxidoreductase family protein n=1 Tax=Sneathiella sp. HT1-7 TaxID=2887192 RepID=UPI001D134196|nr:NADPH:quinone oxidoreductase family protein [Sneathiella sp. HT1-7]MCC3304318.1 NADPH:quinone oxidoreductase family protein [Sneathiella sp. HT1-7]